MVELPVVPGLIVTAVAVIVKSGVVFTMMITVFETGPLVPVTVTA